MGAEESGVRHGIGPGVTSPTDFLAIDSLLSEEQLLLRGTVRRWVAERILPHVGDWFERGVFPAETVGPELGALGLLGMHLEGYGCAGAGATDYGLACMELEAGDSGVRSFMSVQGSLAMFPIRAFGSEEQRRQWLPAMAAGEAVGCFGLTEPDAGSDPAAMRTRARRDGPDWILSGTKMWITNGSIADVAVIWAQTDEGVRGFVVPTGTPGFGARDIPRKLSLRASVTSELVLDGVRLPPTRCCRGWWACGGRCRASTKPASGSSSGPWGLPAPATRPLCPTPATAAPSGGPSAASSSPSRSSSR